MLHARAATLPMRAGVAVITRMLNAAITHYTRTLARPGTALPSRPLPLSGSSAQWDSLTGNICELVSNVSSANSDAQRAFTQVRLGPGRYPESVPSHHTSLHAYMHTCLHAHMQFVRASCCRVEPCALLSTWFLCSLQAAR